MAADLVERARSGDADAYQELVDPFRAELQLHCYQLLGSIHDSEDALQDTLLAAWQGLPSFEGRSSIRTWLHRIATNRCLNRLRAESRRPRTEPGGMPDVPLPAPSRLGEVLWLEPYPDTMLEGVADPAPGPEVRYEAREAVSLAFITALQVLAPRQRAVLILRDVLGYRASEVAQILDSSEESVSSALKRARATLQQRLASGGRERAPAPRSAAESRLVERFTEAFESSDLDSVVELLAEDVWLAMPPMPFEWHGRDSARRFLAASWAGQPAGRRLVATRANGQPAFGLYFPDPHGRVMHAAGLLVLTLAGERIAAITRFDTSVLGSFGLPRGLTPVRSGEEDRDGGSDAGA